MATPKKKSKKRTGLEAATLGSLKNANLRTLGNQAWLTRTQLARKMNPRLLNLMDVSRLAKVPGGAAGALGLSLGAGALIGKHMESNLPISNFQSARGAGRQAFPGPGRDSIRIIPVGKDGQIESIKATQNQFNPWEEGLSLFSDTDVPTENSNLTQVLSDNPNKGSNKLDENKDQNVNPKVEKLIAEKIKDQLSIKALERKGMSLQRGIQGRKWRDELKALKAKTYEE